MTSYPIELNLAGQTVVVIGGGAVAARKVQGLLETGARVRVVSLTFVPELEARTEIARQPRAYSPEVLDDARLVLVCTDDRELNARVAADARSRKVLCNVADEPLLSDFLTPATIRQGAFTIAVGTGGASPLLAARIRDQLASQFGPEFGILVEELGAARRIVQDRVPDPAARRRIFESLCTPSSLTLLAGKGRQAWREWLGRLLEQHVHPSSDTTT